MRSTRLAQLTVLFILVILLLPGCQTNNKPLTPEAERDNTKLSELSPSERRILTGRLSNSAAEVKGVRRAIVVLSSDNKNELVALVGLTLNQGSASQAQSIKNTVTKKVKGVDSRVTQVLVTTDSNLVRRIGDIAAGIIEGKPIKSYARDVKELNRMLQK